LAVFEDYLVFGGNQNLKYAILHIEALYPKIQVFLDQVFLARIGMNDIPTGRQVIFYFNVTG
jgi:hypothetical protein